MKRVVVILVLLALLGAVAYARLSRINSAQKEKAPIKQEQKMEKKKSHHHCMFS
jgi:hypothetical protein